MVLERVMLVCVCVLMVATSAAAQSSTVSVEVEAGPVWQSYNDVEIPNDGSATRFSLYELAKGGPWFAGRAYITWNITERHGIRLLVAPLSLSANGVLSDPISFAGAQFAAGETTKATYTFNSYRLSYRYRIHAADRSTAWIGLTAKIRDAVIEVEQGSAAGRKTDLGFVPLLHFAGDLGIAPKWSVTLDADALAGGPGRAVDASLKLGVDVLDGWRVQAGYRTVEGGADVEEAYTFAWLHYAVVSVRWTR